MKLGKLGAFAVALITVSVAARMSGLETLHASCAISASEKAGKLRLHIGDDCDTSGEHCDGNFSDDSLPAPRITGLTFADLGREGTQLTAMLSSEAGSFACAGTVHDGVLRGQSTFTPNAAFADRMSRMGFSGLDSKKMQAYVLFDIDTAWVESLKNSKISGLTTDNLIAMRIFHIDPAYVSALTALGYETPDADKLIGLKVQGVNAEEVKEIRALGYKPSLDELVQIRIFHITPDFIKRMQARGLQDLSISKLVQIKIFKLDE